MVVPFYTDAASLVPCGRLPGPDTPTEETRACQICDIFELIDRVWKFILTVLVPGVAIILYIAAGILILLYGANPGLQATGKSIFKTTTYGLIIIFAAWMLTNTVMRSLAGDSLDRAAPWYVIQCVNPAQSGPVAQQRYACGSQGCVARSDGQFDNFETCRASCPATQGQTGTCTGVTCRDSNLNICGATPNNCSISMVNQWNVQIQAAVSQAGSICSGVNTARLIKAIMARESGGTPRTASDGESAGLMQMKPETANNYKSQCGVPASTTINFAWLNNPANAQAQVCMAIHYLRSLVGQCGCDVRQLAAGYNGGDQGACAQSRDCGSAAASAGGQCLACSGSSFTRKWECLWDNPQHTQCNVDRVDPVTGRPTNLSFTRAYVPQVNYCYGQF